MATLHPRPTAGPLRAATKGKVAAKQLVGQRPGFTHPVEAVLELVAVGEVGDVASAAEGGPGSGQHHRPGIPVSGEMSEGVHEGQLERVVERVASVGPVQGHDADGTVRFERHQVALAVLHRSSPDHPCGPLWSLPAILVEPWRLEPGSSYYIAMMISVEPGPVRSGHP